MSKVAGQRLKAGFMQVLRVFVDFVQGNLTPRPSPDVSTHLPIREAARERGARSSEQGLILRNRGEKERV